MAESVPGHVHVSIPRGVLWGWVGAWSTGAIAVIVFLLRLAFSLEADLVRAQEQQGALLAELKSAKDRIFHVETVVSDMNTRIVVLEQTRGIR